MNIEKQVCTIEQAKTLSQLGASQENAHFMWFELSNGDDEGDFDKEGVEWVPVLTQQNYRLGEHQSIGAIDSDLTTSDGEFCSHKPDACKAFTVAELGAMLPYEYLNPIAMAQAAEGSNAYVGIWKSKKGFRYREPNSLDCSDPMTEAEARAWFLIYLLGNKMITAEECNKKLSS